MVGVGQHVKQLKPYSYYRKYLIIFVTDSSAICTLSNAFVLLNVIHWLCSRIYVSAGRTSDPCNCNAVGCYKTNESNVRFSSGSLSEGNMGDSGSWSYGSCVGHTPHLSFSIKTFDVEK